MDPLDTYKTFGVLAAALTSVSATYVLLTAEKVQRHRSVSMHVAERRITYWLFAATSVISAILFSLFLLNWFIPALRLPLAFTITIFIGQAAQIVAAFIPHTIGWRAHIHNITAYTMAIAVMLSVPFLLFAPTLAAGPKTFIAIIFAWMLGSFALLYITPQIKNHFLPMQIAYLASFFACIFIATYFSA